MGFDDNGRVLAAFAIENDQFRAFLQAQDDAQVMGAGFV